MSPQNTQVLLAPSASGPPVPQVSFRDSLFSSFRPRVSWNEATEIFQAEGLKVLRLVEALPGRLLCRPTRIEPLPGIADGCCRWSAEMVLEHLIEVGAVYGQIAIELSNGERPRGDLDLARKPSGGRGLQIVKDFRAFLGDYAAALREDARDPNSTLAFPHPRYGPLTAHGWHALAAFHQGLHRRQMERIVGGLRVAKPR
jgi:hypothetical protein